MQTPILQNYLRQLKKELKARGMADEDTLAEIESHLADALEAGLRQGLSLEAAGRQAVERFGDARRVAAQFETERKYIMQKVLFGLALAAGLFIAYVDSRPTWNDTGITVFALLLSSGVIALLGFKRPWLLALAVGVWLPLYEGMTTHNVTLIFVLIFPFIGAYAGWAFRKLVTKGLHSTT